MLTIFVFYLLLLIQKENNEKKRKNLYKKCIHNTHSSFIISYLQTFFFYLILFTDFFHTLFHLPQKIFFFDLTLPILVFRQSRFVLQKRSNLSW